MVGIAVCGAGALPLAAQRTTHIGIGGGVAVPVGKVGDTYTAGPEGLFTIATGPADSPLGLRLDYSYNAFRGKTVNGYQGPGVHINVLSLNVVLAARTAGFKPYLIAGGGWYPYRGPGDTSRVNAFGLNGGVGIGFQLPLSEAGGFIEARYHSAHATGQPDRRFVPVTIGIMF